MECRDTLTEILSFLPCNDIITSMTTNKDFYVSVGSLPVYKEFKEYSTKHGKLNWSLMMASGYTKLFCYSYNSGSENQYWFQFASINGHLNVAQWLYSIGNIDIHINDEEVFRRVCKIGYLIMAKWLYSLGGINIYAKNDCAFRWAVDNGHAQVAEWLYSIGNFDIIFIPLRK